MHRQRPGIISQLVPIILTTKEQLTSGWCDKA